MPSALIPHRARLRCHQPAHRWNRAKLWLSEAGYDKTKAAFQASLDKLGLDRLDLYLIHQPYGDAYGSWRAMQELQQEGLIRAIGVSNFLPAHIDHIVRETGVVPAVNQIEMHPRFQQPEQLAWDRAQGIVTQAWSPLGRGSLLSDERLAAIAARLGRSVGQVILRWHIQHGLSVIPKSEKPERLAENFDVLDFTLTPEEMSAIDALDRGHRTGPDPDTFDYR